MCCGGGGCLIMLHYMNGFCRPFSFNIFAKSLKQIQSIIFIRLTYEVFYRFSISNNTSLPGSYGCRAFERQYARWFFLCGDVFIYACLLIRACQEYKPACFLVSYITFGARFTPLRHHQTHWGRILLNPVNPLREVSTLSSFSIVPPTVPVYAIMTD